MSPLSDWLRRSRNDGQPSDPHVRGDDGGKGTTPSVAPATPHTVIPAPVHSVVPAKASTSPDAATAVVFQAAALVLTYPEEELLTRLATIETALAGTGAEGQFASVLTHLGGKALSKLQSFHIQEFDLSRRHALHLTYWTDGDTRRRGEVLAEIKQVYRDSGLLVDTGGELPDFLPMMLEFAVVDPPRGVALLQRFRASLELLRLGLAKDGLPHAGVLAAVCNCLPGESPQTHAEVQAQYGEARPVELVGLDLRTRQSGHPNGQPDRPNGQLGQPIGQSGHPNGQPGHPNGQSDQPTGQSGHPNGQSGHPNGQADQPIGQPDQLDGQPGEPIRHPREGGDLVTSSRGGS